MMLSFLHISNSDFLAIAVQRTGLFKLFLFCFCTWEVLHVHRASFSSRSSIYFTFEHALLVWPVPGLPPLSQDPFSLLRTL